MTQDLIFLGFTLATFIFLVAASRYYKKVDLKSIFGLFTFGMIIAVPFVLIEHLHLNLSLLYVIAAFIFIELGILYFEHRVHYFHELIHHNVKEMRIASFVLIGLGFTYTEIGLTILSSSGDIIELVNTIPFKTTYALLMHTVFASAASLVLIGRVLLDGVLGTVLRMIGHYIRIGIISISHFLYVFSIENNLLPLIGGVLAIGILCFFLIKKRLDLKPESIE
jgi:hypothetical protein